MKKTLISLATTALLGLAASSANAIPINVGGVVWNPDSTNSFPAAADFFSTGTVIENSAFALGDTVTGFGRVATINSQTGDNSASFCPGCELTYTFSMILNSATFSSAIDSAFTFTNLAVKIFVDAAQNYNGTYASAADGTLWLSMAGRGLLSGIGHDIGTGSDQGSGSSLLDVTGGLAKSNFDTNTKLDGTDMVFTSSFQPTDVPGTLHGNVQLTGNSIPEPGTLALAGLGLLGLSSLRRRKVL